MPKQLVVPPAELLDLGERIDKFLRAALAAPEFRIVRREDYVRHWMQRGPRDQSGYRMQRKGRCSEDERKVMNAASLVLQLAHDRPRACLLCQGSAAFENLCAVVVLQHFARPSEYDVNGAMVCDGCDERDPAAFAEKVRAALDRLYRLRGARGGRH
jgi:hypothetical protein